LPEAIQEKINRYKRWQDRQAALFGKLLLLECLKKYDYPSDCLNNILFDRNGRLYLDHNIDFNISHSGEYVICSIIDKGRVGVDIERIKPIELSGFEQHMTSEQWNNIKKDANGYNKFYEYWTIKESVLKADGRGLSFPLLEIDIDGKRAKLFGNTWFLREINIDSGYSCHLATNIENFEVCVKKINY
jgi:4'-phosphopantetheinyl transferase